QAATKVEAFSSRAMHADLLRARGLVVRKDFAAARTLLARLIDQNPRQTEPLWELSLLCFQDGSGPEVIEQALRDVLRLDPAHLSAQRNLSVLLRQSSLCSRV